jgi:uncharacterized protein (TIGR03435 family)
MRRGFIRLVVAASALGFAAGAAGQTAAPGTDSAAYVPTMTFDVASLKEAQRTDPMMVGSFNPPHNSSVTAKNVFGWQLVTMAYGVQSYQMSGGPDWLVSKIFTLEAKSDAEADAQLAKLSNADAILEKQHMLQALLADRMKLTVHWTTREGDVYNLVVAKGGPRLSPAGSQPLTAEELKWMGDKPVPSIYAKGNNHPGYSYVAHGATMEELARMVDAGTKVIDKTGLTGKYDFTLQYYSTGQEQLFDDATLKHWAPVGTALEQQLGLKLVRAKAPLPALVIDHVEMPAEN